MNYFHYFKGSNVNFICDAKFQREVHAEEISAHGRRRPDSQSTQAAANRHRTPQTEQGDQWPDPGEWAASDRTATVPQGEEQAGVQVKPVHTQVFR